MRIVSYLRVSTARQGASGLGLEAQRAAVDAYCCAGGHSPLAEYVEIESGKRADRPQLEAALATCRLHRTTLIIAKLDRLSRNVAFIANLMNGGVEFVACDMPHANRLTLHLLAAIAEHERDMISQRTKAALAAAKARGAVLGNPYGAAHLIPGCKEAARRSAEVRQHRSRARFAEIAASFGSGLPSNALEIADALNRRGVPAARGGRWRAGQIRRLLKAGNHDG